jgi:hypothetical protein
MTLKEKINQDYKEAFKAKDESRVSTLRMLNSTVKNRELEKRSKLIKSGASENELDAQSVLNDEEMIEVISSEVKKRRDSINQYRQGDRPELANQEEVELAILVAYLPQQMTEEEIRQEVKKAVAASGALGTQDLGKVMKVLMPVVKGKVDGSLVNQIVKEELGN